MADNKRKRGGADKRLISLSEAYEVHYWSRKFKVTPAKLRAAVKRVGHSAKAVEAYLAELAHKARDRGLRGNVSGATAARRATHRTDQDRRGSRHHERPAPPRHHGPRRGLRD